MIYWPRFKNSSITKRSFSTENMSNIISIDQFTVHTDNFRYILVRRMNDDEKLSIILFFVQFLVCFILGLAFASLFQQYATTKKSDVFYALRDDDLTRSIRCFPFWMCLSFILKFGKKILCVKVINMIYVRVFFTCLIRFLFNDIFLFTTSSLHRMHMKRFLISKVFLLLTMISISSIPVVTITAQLFVTHR